MLTRCCVYCNGLLAEFCCRQVSRAAERLTSYARSGQVRSLPLSRPKKTIAGPGLEDPTHNGLPPFDDLYSSALACNTPIIKVMRFSRQCRNGLPQES